MKEMGTGTLRGAEESSRYTERRMDGRGLNQTQEDRERFCGPGSVLQLLT